LIQGTKEYLNEFLMESFDFEKLAQAWRNHRFSYAPNAEKSTKTPFAEFAKEQEASMSNQTVAAQKFKVQLHQILMSAETDFVFLLKRVEAATGYFIPIFRKIHLELLFVIEHVKRQKRSKEFYNELLELEDLMSQGVGRLFKSVKLVEVIHQGSTVEKSNLDSKDFHAYLVSVRDEAMEMYKSQSKNNLIPVSEEIHDSLYDKKPKNKGQKISTYEETLILWKENQSVDQIAETRKLTKSTILSHFAKLITQNEIQIDEVISKDRIIELQEAFKGNEDKLISEVKEIVGDSFDWGELRIYKAFLDRLN
jgi:uncharacterized protein YpbB